MSVGSLVYTVQSFIHTYGLFALFVYVALETGLILHFAPSEIIIPAAAIELVHDWPSFTLFVLVATTGATLGALIPYAVFSQYGRSALDEYGHLIHVSKADIDRGDKWFRRWGESSVLWGRLLPFFRGYIAIPAGLAEMDARRYTLYSALGAIMFNTGITYLTWREGAHIGPSYKYIQQHASLPALLTIVRLHLLLTICIVLLIVSPLFAIIWWRRNQINGC